MTDEKLVYIIDNGGEFSSRVIFFVYDTKEIIDTLMTVWSAFVEAEDYGDNLPSILGTTWLEYTRTKVTCVSVVYHDEVDYRTSGTQKPTVPIALRSVGNESWARFTSCLRQEDAEALNKIRCQP